MAERQQYLRAAMQQKSAVDMKEKVKLLKMQNLRDRQSKSSGSGQETTGRTTSSLNASARMEQPQNSLMVQSAVLSPTEKEPSNSSSVPVDPNPLLPTGFFDDVYEDFKARGINIHKERAKQDEIEKNSLNSFLEDIHRFDQLQENVDEEEEASRELEEEAMQISYMARVASLMYKAVNRDGKDEQIAEELFKDSGAVISTLASASSVSTSADISSATTSVKDNSRNALIERVLDVEINEEVKSATTGSDFNVDVESILRKKAKKRKANNCVDDYVPLDYTNWTSKNI